MESKGKVLAAVVGIALAILLWLFVIFIAGPLWLA